jgi:drug/metabolite transporter (DMT)-like permease
VLEGRAALLAKGHGWRLFTYGTVGFAGFNLLAYAGLAHSRPEHAAVIMAMMPMITVLVSWVRSGQRPATFTLMSVAIAFIGVFLVVTNGNPERALQNGEASGDLLLLIAAVCWVTYTLGADKFPSWSALRYTALSCALGTLSILAVTGGLAIHGDIQLPTLSVVVGFSWEFSYLVVLGAVVAVLSWNAGIKAVGAINGVLFINLVPVTAFLIGLVQGHDFGHEEILGALLVTGALVANNLYSRYQLAAPPRLVARETVGEEI